MSQVFDQDPHHDATVMEGCTSLGDSSAVMVLLHGRGGSARDMLVLADEIGCQRCACLALQAVGNSWYPYSFLERLDRNEPWLSSALARLEALFTQLEKDGIPSSKIALIGFSQGACLALEYAARYPRQYGALVGLSGGLIGPAGTSWEHTGSLEGTPVFLGCSNVDPHIPLERVNQTAQVLEQMGGQVTKHIYPRMGHTVSQAEIDSIQAMLQGMKQ